MVDFDKFLAALSQVVEELQSQNLLPEIKYRRGSDTNNELTDLDWFSGITNRQIILIALASIVSAVDELMNTKLRKGFAVIRNQDALFGWEFEVTDPDYFSPALFIHYFLNTVIKTKQADRYFILNDYLPNISGSEDN